MQPIMKKLFVLMCVALLSMSAQAQEKGDFAIGLRGGPTINKINLDGVGIEESVTRWGVGAFAQYGLSNHFRLDFEGIYHPKKNNVSDFQLGLDIQYLFNVADGIKVFPLLGYALAFQKTEAYTVTDGRGSVSISHDDESTTDGGIQIGAGVEFNLGSNCFISGEYRFQPGIFGDGHCIMASVGYRF